ncbi:MAG: T9SS type A sorting domain-containing protein [Cytophagaceae bacterium]|nr:T9SS type A sorting domain-containing protein [Cytophagaceae bacterium]
MIFYFENEASGLAGGMYIVRVEGEEGVITKKAIKK